MTARCIYCRNELTGVSGDQSRQPSLEHIVPLALGGSAKFTTMDVSAKYNHDLGTSIDAPFMNQLPIAMLRHQLGLAGNSGKIPPIVLNARSLDNNEPARISISPDGSIDYQFETMVIDDQKTTHTERLVAGSPERVREILSGMLKKAKSAQKSIYSLQGNQVTSLDNILGQATVEETTTFKASVVAMDGTTWVRGLFKMILGLGHVVLGPDWTFSADGGDRLRTVLFCEPEQWPNHALKGFSAGAIPADVARMLGITNDLRREKWHTLAIIPRGKDCEYVAVVSLFGGDLPDSLVTLGSERGWLTTVNETMRPDARIGVRIDPVTREVVWITVKEALDSA